MDVEPLSFDEAVRLFTRWGFQVEPGPRSGEVTLILDSAGARTWVVYEAALLPQIAEIVLRVRWQNKAALLLEDVPLFQE